MRHAARPGFQKRRLSQFLPYSHPVRDVRHRDNIPVSVGRLLQGAGHAGVYRHVRLHMHPVRRADLRHKAGSAAMGLETAFGHSFFTSRVDDAVNWARKYSFFQYPFVTACCGMEFMSVWASSYDIARFGAEFPRFSPRQADVMCNKEVKFGAFLRKALSMGADFVATGHYAIKNEKYTFLNGLAERTREEDRGPEKKNISYFLNKGKDLTKDQAYFLWTLKQEQLSKIIFPVGHLEKMEVRKLAKKFKLPVAEKKDSQGICFLGAVDLKDFLKHYIQEKKR